MKRLDKKNIENILALTPLQEGMLFHFLKEPEGTQYSEQLCLDISGQLDIKYFEQAWDVVTKTNEMLRTQFRWEKLEKHTQIILKEHKCNLHIYDLTEKNNSQEKAALEKIKSKDRQKTLDLRCVPFRVSLCKIAENKYQLIISNHHILYDGWSTGIILREFFDVYHALSSGNPPVKPPAKPSFKEFIQWIQSQDKTKQKQFWTGYLAGFENPTGLPIKTRRKAGESKSSAVYSVTVTGSIKGQIEIFIKAHRVTLASFFFSAWGILLQRYCNTEEVIFGTTVSGRSAPIKDIQDMVGLFINTIPLRIDTGIGEKVKDLLYRVNDSLPIREKYESTPLVDIKEYSQLESNVDLFDSLIAMENYPLDHNLMDKNSPLPLVVDSYSMVESTNYDLAVTITIGEMVGINFIYNPTSLEKPGILRLASHFSNIIENILYQPNGLIHGIEILSAAEKKQVLYDFNETETAYPQDKTIHQLFVQQAELTPHHTALVGVEGTRGLAPLPTPISITYRELNWKSNQLARLLREKGVKPDTIAGIMIERSIEMVIGILGILKAGGAYLPIDPEYPAERVDFMLKDSNVGVLVTTPKLQLKVNAEVDKGSGQPQGLSLQVINIEKDILYFSGSDLLTLASTLTSTCPVSPANLAYTIYTSGSTGQPKGVIVRHSSVVNLLWALHHKYPFRESDVYLLKTSYFFDVSVCELFGWFLGGGRLAVLEQNGEKDPGKILDTIENARVTHINFVPSMFKVFTDTLNPQNIEKLSTLKYIFLAGETLLPQLINRFRHLNAVIALENIYGPTETTVYASWYSLSLWSGEDIIPIGKPLPNVQLFILDCNLNLQPVGVPGELSTAGVGLARGYLNHPELTSERFCLRRPGGRFLKKLPPWTPRKNFLLEGTKELAPLLYHTGDLARWLPDGNVEFLGRMDHQVKIRGLRIELEEIENQLLVHHQIKEAVVIARQDNVGEGYLAAYIVPGSTELTDPGKMDELRSYLSLKLPDYMIPSGFVLLERIPLTPSGKVDRKALPKPEITSKKAYIAPGTETERVLAGLWSEVLGIQREKISINDNFFELGGHSLKVASLISRIHKVFDIEIPYSKFFQFPSIRGIVSYIKEVETWVHQPVPRAELKEYYPLNSTQKQFYVAQQVKHGDTHYNMNEIMQMQGVLSVERFESAFRRLLRRHESLRISFHLVDGEPVQKVNRHVAFNIEYYDGETANQQELAKITRDFVRPFDLAHAPLWRIGLVEIASDKHLLMVDMNHLIADGTSIGIFIRDFNLIYNQEPLPILNISYRDYLEWDRKLREGARKKTGTSSGSEWFEEFENEPLALPTDFPRPAVPDFAGNTIKFDIGIDRVKALYDFSIKHDVTLYMVLLAVFNVLLAKLSNQETIPVGSPMGGRVHIDMDNLMGLFLTTLCLRNRPGGEKQFLTFLQEVKERTAYTFDHQEYQYNELLDRQNPGRDVGRNPLYDVMLVLQNMEMPEINIPGLTFTREVGDYLSSKFDMTLYCEENDPMVFKLEYSTALFKQETIQRFIRYFEEIISRVLENPHQKIADIEILPPQEKRQILYDFNDTKVEYPGDRCIYQLIETQSRKTPDQIALAGVHETHKKHEKNNNRSPGSHLSYISYMSYKELNEKSNQLACFLRAKGIQPDTIVGIMLEPSLLVVMGILAVLKAGGAYLPLDPEYPEQRIISMLEHSRSSLVLTHSSIMKKKTLSSGSLSLEVVGIEEMEELFGEPAGVPGEDLEPISGPGNLIYIIFTSGSTGVPKGAGVYHRGFVNLLHWFVTEFELNSEDRNLFLTSLSFDLTQKNLYAPLITGGTVLMPGVGYFDPRSLLKQTRQQEVTWINCTPSMFYKMVEYDEAYHYEGLSGLRYVFLGGEPIAMSFLLPWLESGTCRTEIVNTYGPTECTDICNFYRVKEPGRFMKEEVPLGMPVYNVQLYIVDRHLQLTPVGAAGELIIGGAGVGKGYINDKDLTTRKFITHSFDPEQPPQLLYKTGDLAKWLPDGNMVFLGRIDHQVKVRGFRIELGEIEKRLLEHEAVKEAVVLVQEEKNNEKNLCAYIVLHPGSSLQNVELREYLSRELPAYMVPAYVVQLEKILLNPNGKVDRKALPEPDLTAKDNYVPPQNDTEIRLAEIWAEVLGLDKKQVGTHDNFFLSGGHSLKATTLIGKIHKAFSVEIPIAEIFKRPTIKKISRYLDQGKEGVYLSIAPVEKREYYPLSSAQKRLFVIEQMDPGNVTYNIPAVLKLEGKLDINCVAGSFKKLIVRHESLRTSFQLIAGEPIQKVHDDVEFEIEYFGAHELHEKNNKKFCRGPGGGFSKEPPGRRRHDNIIKNFICPFDLSHVPLLRVGLIELPHTPSALRGHPSQEGKENKYLLMFDMHHIISDGISMQIFIREFTAFYQGEVIPGLRIQYKDFSHWQNALLDSGAIKPQESYWLECFAGEIPVLTLPYDFPRPAVQTHRGSSLEFTITLDQTQQLKQLALESKTTPFIVLLAVFNVLLSRLSGQEDIVVGSPATGRRHPDLESLIGVFINTLALRNYPTADRSFDEFLAEVKRNSLEAYENQDYQYEELVEKVEPQRDLSRSPLFDVMLVVVPNMEMAFLDIPGIALRPVEYPQRTSKFDMTVTAVEKDHQLDFTMTYSRALFTQETIRRFIKYFKRVLAAVLKDIKQKIAGIDILADDEKKQLLYGFNLTEKSYSSDKTIHRLFEEQVAQTPDYIAVIGAGPATQGPGSIEGTRGLAPLPEPMSITYKELNKRANQLGQLLRRKGIIRETITAIMLDPSLDMMIGILAVLKAGGAYLPIDPQQQAGRVIYMLKDSRAVLLLTRRHLDHAPDFGVPSLAIDRADVYKGGGNNPERKTSPADVVYTIYTSGTTGKSKGTLIENKNLVNYVCWFREKVHLTGKDRTVLTSSFSFDLGYTAIYPSILTGCQLHIIPGETYLSPEDLISYINQHGITYIKVTPSLFTTIVESSKFSQTACPMLRLVVLGGEEIKLKDVEKAHRIAGHLHFMNHYGPTEATIGCVARFIDFSAFSDYQKRPTIGAPIDNMKVVILGNGLMLVPVSVAGELSVSGASVARGYLNQPELTARKFLPVSHMFNRSYMSYFYKTGDMARWTSRGDIEFLGRIDTQVKIRGYRIEAGEIENRLLTHEAVNEAVVIPREHPSADKYLCAYIVLKNPGSINIAVLKEYLAVELPDYMIPPFFVELERIPLTPNGKLNRKLLPEPDMGALTAYYTAPRDPVETKLSAVWQEILEADRIGIDDHFFQLGGHSLKAIILISRINKTFHIDVPLAEIFKTPTIRGLSAYIKSKRQGLFTPIEPVEEKDYHALSSAQKRLYILHQMDEGSTGYNMPYILELEGEANKNKLEEIFLRLIARHESLRTSFHILDGAPVQRIHDDVEFEIEYNDLKEVKVEEKRLEGTGGLAPWRVGLIKLLHTPTALRGHPSQEGKEDKYLLMVDMHHIISDGISRRLLVREFMALAAEKDLPPLRLQYKDFSAWQDRETQREALIKQKAYWKKQLGGEIPVLDLPVDYARPTIQRFEGSTVAFEIDQEEVKALQSLALAEGMTLYMILLGIYYILLSKLSNQEDILVGTPTMGRRHADLEQIIGMFVNTLVLRNYPTGHKTYRGFSKEIKKRSLQAFENQDYPYEDLVEEVEATRDASRNPLIDTMFVMQNLGVPRIEIPGLKLTPGEHQVETSKFDLLLIGVEAGEKLSFTFEYSTRLFTANTIRRFIGYFHKIVTTIIGNPAVKLAEIEIISEEEKQQILEEFNHIHEEYPRDKTILRLYEEQVERIPDHVALEGQSSGRRAQSANEERSALCALRCAISYRELNERSERLSHLLRERGVKPGTLVGIMVNRSLEMIVGILGILKTGSGYVPLNPKSPAARKKYILDECNINLLLTDSLFSQVSEISEGIEGIELSPALREPPLEPGKRSVQPPNSLFYVIFTSGSMGKPKGVPITHANICPLLHWGYRHLGLDQDDHVLQNLSYYFDWSVWEIFITLTSGSSLYITVEEVLLNPLAILEYMLKNDITVLHITPTQFQGATKAAIESGQTLKTLKHLYIGAEKLTYHLVETTFALIKEDCRLFNMYGPTEASIMSAVLEIHQPGYEKYKEISSIPIGKCIANAYLLVLDKHLNMCPVNITGELYIAGDGLASGYLNRPQLTAERFINMSHMSYKSYIYKSGDLVRWLPDGNIEFLGRIDLQVKIRGYRIELGEIEKRLLTHEKIKQVAVIVLEKGESSSGTDKYLCAYLVADKDIDTTEVKKYLSLELPDYMVPPYFVILDRLPLNPNGKIDRRALPAPEIADSNQTYAAPRNEIERKLVEVWQQLLDVERIGIHDDFFAIGGHSLKVLNLVNSIQKEFNVKINFQDIFLYPTVAKLYDLIRQSERTDDGKIENQPEKEYYDLSYAQKRLWLLYQLEPGDAAFNLPTLITLYDRVEETVVQKALEKLVQRHESFRTYFKSLKGGVVQIIPPQTRLNMEIFDLTGLEDDAREERRTRLYQEESFKAFQLEKPPLFRVKLIKCKDSECDVILTMHHIITDGWSMEILEHEFLLLYESYKAGTVCELKPLKLRYIDYIYWQEHFLADKEKIAAAKKFWEKQLKGNYPVLDLPYDFPKKNMARKESSAYRVVIPAEITGQLKKIARNRKASLFMILLAGFKLLLHRVTGQDDILIAIPAAARQHEDLKNLVGFFVNTLIIRNQINPGETFSDFLTKVLDHTLQALEYQSFPLELLCAESKLRYPEISVFFNMPLFRYTQQEDLKDDEPDHVETVQDAKFDMVCYLVEYNNIVTIETHYYKELFKPITIEKIMRLYCVILEDIARNPEKQVGEYQYSLTREKRKLAFSSPARV
jgi:tyrocidine synthetase-3